MKKSVFYITVIYSLLISLSQVPWVHAGGHDLANPKRKAREDFLQTPLSAAMAVDCLSGNAVVPDATSVIERALEAFRFYDSSQPASLVEWPEPKAEKNDAEALVCVAMPEDPIDPELPRSRRIMNNVLVGEASASSVFLVTYFLDRAKTMAQLDMRQNAPGDVLVSQRSFGARIKGLFRGGFPYWVGLCASVGPSVAVLNMMKDEGYSPLAAGVGATVAAGTFSPPVWTFYARKMKVGNPSWSLKDYFLENGTHLPHYYRGYGMTVLTWPASATFFWTADKINEYLKAATSTPDGPSAADPLRTSAASFMARTLVSIGFYPFETVRAIKQSSKPGEVPGYRAIFSVVKSKGLSRLYAGYKSYVLQQGLATAVTFGTASWVKNRIEKASSMQK